MLAYKQKFEEKYEREWKYQDSELEAEYIEFKNQVIPVESIEKK